MTQLNINIHHVTRVEGHGNIVVNAKDGKVEEIKWEIAESPRFFEWLGFHAEFRKERTI